VSSTSLTDRQKRRPGVLVGSKSEQVESECHMFQTDSSVLTDVYNTPPSTP